MIWLIGISAFALIIFLLSKGGIKAKPITRQQPQSAQDRAKLLPESEKVILSAEIRKNALEQYNMAKAKAKEAGKNDEFAHQVGVLRAVTTVMSPGQTPNSHSEQELQMETVPFNELLSNMEGTAVSEYLVYKFFPDKADEGAFSPTLANFKKQIFADAERQQDPYVFLFKMIYCVKYDWQRYIAAMP